MEDASAGADGPQRTSLSLAQLVALLEADQIALARRPRRTVAETLATTAGRLRSGGDLAVRQWACKRRATHCQSCGLLPARHLRLSFALYLPLVGCKAASAVCAMHQVWQLV